MRCVVCAVSRATWLLFTGVTARCVVLRVRCPGPLGSCSPVCPLGAFVLRVQCPGPLGSCSLVCPLGALCCVCADLGHLAPVHWRARSVRCCACAVSWATWLLFTSVPAWFVVLFALSWATWLLFTGVPARCVLLRVRCPGPVGSCSPVCPLGPLLCVCGVLGHLAPVHRCARLVRSCACAVSCPTRLLFTGVPAPCVVLRVRCPGLLGSCSLVCQLGALCCVCGVLGHLAPVHRCARSVRCCACAVSWATWLLFTGSRSVRCVSCAVSSATWLLFTGVPARCVVLCVRCPGPLESCSPECLLGALCCVCGVLGHLAPVHWCDRSVRCVVCAVSWPTWLLFIDVPARCVSVVCVVSWATWLLFTGAPARCVALLVRCPGPLGSCSPVLARCVVFRVWCPGPLGLCSLVCLLGALCCVCGVLGHLAPVHWSAYSVRCVLCPVSWATWLMFTGATARCAVLRVRCPGPLGSCSSMCPLGAFVLRVRCPGPLGYHSLVYPLGALCCVCGVLGHLAPVHWCARSVRCVACAVSWATWLLFTDVPEWFVVLFAVSWATWLLFTGVPARCAVLRVRCPGPLGSCSPVCPLGRLLCVCGVLGHLAPVHWCARSVRCFAGAVSWATWLLFTGACSVRCVLCAVSWGTWLLFTGVPARSVAVRVRCPGPLGSCSPVRPLGALLCLCGVLANLAPVHRCARSMRSVACAVSWATWLLFTGLPARCVVLRVRCPGPLGYSSLVCPLGALCCVCGVLGHLAPVHRCARSVRCCACAVSWATWLLFTGAPARCVALLVRCPGPLGSCSPVLAWCVVFCVRCPGALGSCSPSRPLHAFCCVCGVLGHLAPVHQCALSVCCVAYAVSWATWLLFICVPARSVFMRVWCPGPLSSFSPVCPLVALCCVCGVLGHSTPVHRCARSVRCFACAVSWATWLLFTGVPTSFVVLRVWCL